MKSYKTIVLEGKEYWLVPVEDGVETHQSVSKPRNEDIMAEYQPPVSKGVRKAVGKLSEYRERFKQRKLTLADLPKRKLTMVEIPEDKSLDGFNYEGEKLFFGPGTQQLV